jgi:cytochrome c-type biogenesis protein CcmF
MFVEIGHYALVLAFALALIQSTVPMWGAMRGDAQLMAVGGPTALAQLAFVALSFAALTYAYVQSDFSVINVIENSHSQKPLLFKITGVWGNHEGSMLLWVLILALFGGLVALFSQNLPDTLRANVLAVQAWVAVAFYLFILLTSNPFARVEQAPFEGRDLNPILQDIGLAVHPPLLYLGYVGLSISFAFAVAALIEGRIDAAWARWVRPWTLAAWVFLTLGISMGSYWAYYELGWGGWWFWDPVENASFMPWLIATALLHSAIVMEKRNALKVWTLLLAILAFALSLLGTFLVRSGVLTSVHAFATDPQRGVFILAILTIFVGGSLALFAWRAPMLQQGGVFAPVSREGALVLNNLFLSAACAAVFVGTLYPLFAEAVFDQKISVGEPFFNLTFGPLMIPLLMAVPLGPYLAWKRGDLKGVLQRLWLVFALTVVITAVLAYAKWGGPILAPILAGLAVWLMLGAVADLLERAKAGRESVSVSARRLFGLPRSVFGMALAHFGLGMTLLGITAEYSWKQEQIVVMKPGEAINLGDGTITLTGVTPRTGPNYQDQVARFVIREGGAVVAEVESAKRLFTARQMPTSEVGLVTRGLFSQYYVALGEPQDGGGWSVRMYYKPLILLIWLGTVVMSLGGLISLTDRRFRVGAPKAARVPARAAVPAE